MLSTFTHIIVDPDQESKFRWRALKAYPNEHMEQLWGHVRGDKLYICVFMPMKTLGNGTTSEISYEDEELDHCEEDAKEHKLEFLGTIHSHPDVAPAELDDDHETLIASFSKSDMEDAQTSNEMVMGICCIWRDKTKKRSRKKSLCSYWPTLRPLQVEYRKFE